MLKSRWLLTLPVALAAMLGAGTSHAVASGVHDEAGFFSKSAVAKADGELSQIQAKLGLDTKIETIESLDGDRVQDVAVRHARRAGGDGIFILIAKKETKFWMIISRAYRATLLSREPAIAKAFLSGFHQKDFDEGLLNGVATIRAEAEGAKAEYGTLKDAAGGAVVRRNHGAPMRRGVPVRGGGGFGLAHLLGIGLVILGVLFVVRLLGALFSGGARYGQPGRMGGPGYGPGYGGGGGGGGFMSGLLGGLGGAVAGNWLYDQFSGRHHGGYTDNTGYDQGTPADSAPADDWGGGGGTGGDWGGGGGDAGGGGDWGGGGGDWGGGGGDW
jgi:hypothetical protein